MDLICTECGEYFSPSYFSFGDSVECPRCGVLLITERIEDRYEVCCRVVGLKSDESDIRRKK